MCPLFLNGAFSNETFVYFELLRLHPVVVTSHTFPAEISIAFHPSPLISGLALIHNPCSVVYSLSVD